MYCTLLVPITDGYFNSISQKLHPLYRFACRVLSVLTAGCFCEFISCSSGKILRLEILWHSDDDTVFPASPQAGNIQMSLQSPLEDDDLEVICKAPFLPDFGEFPPLSLLKDFLVNMATMAKCIHLLMAQHRSLSEIGSMFLSACDFTQTSEMLVFHVSFMGKAWQ